MRPGPLGHPRRGVGRLALETGAVVVPVAVIGTAERAPRLAHPPAQGPRALRRRRCASRRSTGPRRRSRRPSPTASGRASSCSGSGSAARRRCAASRSSAPARGARASRSRSRARGPQVELGCRTEEQAASSPPSARTGATCPGVALPDAIRVARAADARPARRRPRLPRRADARPARRDGRDRRPARPAHDACSCSPRVSSRRPASCRPPSAPARAGGRTVACLGGPAHAADALEHGASLVARLRPTASCSPSCAALCADAGFDVETTSDVVGVDLAGVAKNAAVLAATTASVGGPNASGAAAGQGLLRDRRLRRRARRAARDVGRARRRRATSSPRSSPPAGATAAPASCSPAASAAARSARRSARSPRRSTRCRCS